MNRRDRHTGGVLAFLAFLAVSAAWIFDPRFDFSLWDNFENFTGMSLHIHRLWLEGHLPILNIHQAMGLPMAGNGYSGVLYFPYTLGLLFLQVFGLDEQALPELMALLHFPLAAVGWWKLMRGLTVKNEFALPTALGILSCGFYIVGHATWQHIGLEYAWLPWTLYFAARIWTDPSPVRAYAGFGITWFLMSVSSHIQHLVYSAMNVLLFSGCVMIAARQTARWRRALLPLIWMPFLALPSVIYLLQTHGLSQRSTALPDTVFFEGSLPIKQLLGLFTPFFEAGGGVFGLNTSLLFFTGLAVPIGLVLIGTGRPRMAWPALVCSLLFLDFSLGENSLFFRFTKAIPVWSSFRWPYKFSFHAISMLSILAAVGLSAMWSRLRTPARVALISAALLISLAIRLPRTSLEILMVVAQTGILLSWILTWRHRAWLGAGFATAYLALALVQSFAQPSHRYLERYGDYGAAYFGMDETLRYRLIPVSFEDCVGESCRMQAQATFDSATANGYLSLSGTIVGTIPSDFSSLIAGNVWGLLNPRTLNFSVASPLLRSLGLRYYLRQNSSSETLDPFLESKGLRRVNSRDGWTLFEDLGAKMVVSVPDRVVPAPPGRLDVQMYGLAGENSAVVEGVGEFFLAAPAEIQRIEWLPGRGVKVAIENESSSPSFLVVSLYPYSFLKAYVNGKQTRLYRTNFVASGVTIEPGRHSVVIQASAVPMVASCVVALTLFVFGMWLGRWKFGTN